MIVEIITPNGVLFQDEAISITAPGSKGSFQVLNNHAELLTTLDVGAIEIAKSSDVIQFTCNLGLLEVRDNKVIVLAESSENVSDIDEDRAKKARDRAQSRLNQKNSDFDLERAELALTKALNRLKYIK
jgi:F-type H+-transporting ATPase subunit epsilon